jgi:hypothetical protein
METSWPVIATVVLLAAGYPILIRSDCECQPRRHTTDRRRRRRPGIARVTRVSVGGFDRDRWSDTLGRPSTAPNPSLRRGGFRVGVVVNGRRVGTRADRRRRRPPPDRLTGTPVTGVSPAAIGSRVAQPFGNALWKEVVFRAFLLNQFRHGRQRRLTTAPRWSPLLAFVTSQGVFALIHVPSRLVGREFTPVRTVRPDAVSAVRLWNPAGCRL